VKTRTFVSKHLPVPLWFHQTPPDDFEDWCEGKPGAGRVIGVKSVLFSDGSARLFYKMSAVKKKRKGSTHERH
jgi:hypothetical protein